MSSTPAEAILAQHALLRLAEAQFKKAADALEMTVNPDTATWGDTALFAHLADIAKRVIEDIGDIGE